MQFQPTSEPCKHDWRLKNNKYQMEWFEGEAYFRVMDIFEVDETDLGILSTNLLP